MRGNYREIIKGPEMEHNLAHSSYFGNETVHGTQYEFVFIPSSKY